MAWILIAAVFVSLAFLIGALVDGDPRGIVIAGFALVVTFSLTRASPDQLLGITRRSGQELERAPYASVIPPCADGTKETDARFQKPPRGTYYQDRSVISLTERTCKYKTTFRRHFELLEFASQADAGRYLLDVENFARGSRSAWITTNERSWRPGRAVNQFVRTDFRSDESCDESDEGCVVEDSLYARVGDRWVIVVAGEDRAAQVMVQAMIHGDHGVIGNPQWATNEARMDDFVREFYILTR